MKESTITSKVFVGNLSFDTSPSELETLFEEIGPVGEVFLPTDRATGRPRGFAFVELEDSAAVEAAIEKLDGYELRGRNLRVTEAQERRPSPRFAAGGPPPPSRGRGGKGGAGRPKGSRRNARSKKRSL